MSDTPINDGGPAFASGNPEQGGYKGMSLRDYFAGQAICGLLSMASSEAVLSELAGMSIRGNIKVSELLAVKAYNHADAMIAHREVK